MMNNQLNMIMPVSILYDIDIGVIRYIQSYWDLENDYFFNDNIFIEDEYEIKKLLISRDDPNPLSPFFNHTIPDDAFNNIKECMDYLFVTLITESYEDIFELSEPTDYINAAKLIKSTKGVTLNIMANFDYEKDAVISALGSNINFVDNDIDTSIYNVVFLKYIDNINDIVISKDVPFHLYIPDYKFNLDIKNKDVLLNLSNINKDSTIFTHKVMDTVSIIQLYTDVSAKIYGGLLNEE